MTQGRENDRRLHARAEPEAEELPKYGLPGFRGYRPDTHSTAREQRERLAFLAAKVVAADSTTDTQVCHAADSAAFGIRLRTR